MLGSSAATTTVTGADSRAAGGCVQRVGEVAVRGHAVVPVGGADVLGALRVQLPELGVAAVGAEPRGDLGVAPPGQLGDGGAPAGGVAEQLGAEEHPPHVARPRSWSRRAVATANAVPEEWPQSRTPGQPARGDLGDDLLDHLRPSARTARCSRGQVVTGQLDGVHRQPAAAQRAGHRLEVHRVAAGVGEADQRTGLRTGRLRQRLQQPGRAARRRPSISAARSASTGWRVTSLSDTARSRAIASFTADSDVPPRSKKWSRRPIWSCGIPSTFAHAAASRCSVGVRGAIVVVLDDVELGGERRQRLPVDLAVGGQRQALLPVERPTAPCSRAATRPAGRAARRPRAAARPA